MCIEADCCGLFRTVLAIFVLRLIISIVLSCGYVLHGSELALTRPTNLMRAAIKLCGNGYKTSLERNKN